jgi:hypothetical protein
VASRSLSYFLILVERWGEGVLAYVLLSVCHHECARCFVDIINRYDCERAPRVSAAYQMGIWRVHCAIDHEAWFPLIEMAFARSSTAYLHSTQKRKKRPARTKTTGTKMHGGGLQYLLTGTLIGVVQSRPDAQCRAEDEPLDKFVHLAMGEAQLETLSQESRRLSTRREAREFGV